MEILGKHQQQLRNDTLLTARNEVALPWLARAGMSEFVAVTDIPHLEHRPLLMTTGALTCTIIALEFADGRGALAHFGDPIQFQDYKRTFAALTGMRNRVAGGQVVAVGLAAGDQNEYRLGYETNPLYAEATHRIAVHLGIADNLVRWERLTAPRDVDFFEGYDAAVFLPARRKLLLFTGEERWGWPEWAKQGPLGPFSW